MGDGDGIELLEGQDFPQRSDGINRGNGGGGKTLLVVGQAGRLESQQIIDGDVVVPAACKMVSGLFISCRRSFEATSEPSQTRSRQGKRKLRQSDR